MTVITGAVESAPSPDCYVPPDDDYFSREIEEASKAGMKGFMARALVQATMPHRQIKGREFIRKNGRFTLGMWAMDGLPYGSVPRLLMVYVTTEAVKSKSPTIFLGDTLSEFLRKLGLYRSGGRRGDITRFQKQMERLFSCAISCSYDDGKYRALENITPFDSADLWWKPMNSKQIMLFQSKLTLNQRFFNEIIENPVPVRMKALQTLKNSPMALDIYMWTTYRNFYTKQKISRIRWEALQTQFGAGYPLTPRGKLDFKKNFLLNLRKVAEVYPDATKLRAEENALIFVCGRPDVPPRIIV